MSSTSAAPADFGAPLVPPAVMLPFSCAPGFSCIHIAAHLPLACADECTRELLWQSDGLHLNPAGYDRIAELVAAFLKPTF